VDQLFDIIHEDSDLLVVNKPADLVCHPTKGDVFSSLISRVRLHLGKNSQPHLVNRLDRETSGVIIVAKNPEAALELRRIWETRAARKEYLAIVHGHVAADRGTIDAPLGKDTSSRIAIKDCVRLDGAPSQTGFQVERRFSRREGDFTLLRVDLFTGRKHQIRIHLADSGHPIVGDKIYGEDEDIYLAMVERRLTVEQRKQLLLPNHALHAAQVKFSWRNNNTVFAAEPEPWFADFINGATSLFANGSTTPA
jgi:23S rRNA pseudouridine1911/1915/1917 synthase